MTRPKRSLAPQQLRVALQKHFYVPLRSELHGHYLDLFVDHRQLSSLGSADWHVVFGRRGTGKSFLLGVLSEMAKGSFDSQRVLAISLSAQDFVASPAGRSLSDGARALGYFQMFIEQLTGKLVDKVESVLKSPSYMDVLLRKNSRVIARAEELALEILSLSQVGRPVAGFGEPLLVTEETREENGWEVSAGGKLSGELSTSGVPGAGAELYLEAERKRERVHSKVSSGTNISVPRFSDVRQRLVQLLELLDISRLVILIDEWSALDPTAGTAIQPEFAELLKRTLWGTPRISVKIASTQFQTRLSNRQAGQRFRGLELGADIFEATNLDNALPGWTERYRFYSGLLFKRLVFCEPELQQFDQDQDGLPESAFIESIFRTQVGFEKMLKAAEGVPRDLLTLFNGMAKLKHFSVDPLWDVNDLLPYFLERSVSNLRNSVDYQSEADQLLSQCIKSIVKTSGSRTFFVTHASYGAVASALEELLEKRLIHELPVTKLSDAMRDDYRGFVLDYGLWLDWSRSSNGVDDEPPQLDEPRALRSLTLDSSLLRRQDIIVCVNCQASFSKDARSYAVRKLCPTCFEPADDPGGMTQAG